MENVGKTKIKKTIFFCEELLVGQIKGLPRGVKIEDPETTVISPNGFRHECSLADSEGGYAIKFTPKAMGIHTAEIKIGPSHVPGSPFRFAIEPFEGSHMQVRLSGPGLTNAGVGRPSEFYVRTIEAGAGALSVAAEGPRMSRIDFRSEQNGVAIASVLFSHPGTYKVAVKFNGSHVPNSPIDVNVG